MTDIEVFEDLIRRSSLCNSASIRKQEDDLAASDIEAALQAVDIDLYDDKALGKMRSSYDVLLDLSRVWQTLSDAQKNIIINLIECTSEDITLYKDSNRVDVVFDENGEIK